MSSESGEKQPAEARPRASQLWQVPGILLALAVFLVAAYIAGHPIETSSTRSADFAALTQAYESANAVAAVSSAQRFLKRYPSGDEEAFARFVLAYGKWQLTMSDPAATRADLAESLASFRKALMLGLAPQYVSKVLWAQGDILSRLGLAGEAAEVYSLLLEKYPSEKKALLELAVAYSQEKPPNMARARETIARYLSIEGLSADEVRHGYLASARMELSMKDYDAAAAAARTVIDSGAEGEVAAQAVLVLNDSLIARGDYAAALAVLQQAPFDAAGRFQASLFVARAVSLWKTGASDQARKAFDETIFKYPGTPDALSARYELARFFFESGQIDAAKDALINLLDDMSAQQTIETPYFTIEDVTDLWFDVGRAILDQKDYGAVRDFHSAAAALMSQGHFLFFDAALYLREAEQQESLLSGLPPQQLDAAKASIARTYHEAGVTFTKVLETASGDLYSHALYNAGHCFFMAGDFALAAHYLKVFAAANLKDERVPIALYHEANALAALGRYEPAILVCKGNAERHPTNIYSYRSILLQGDLYRNLGGDNLKYAADVYSGILTDYRFLAASPEWRSAIFSLGETLYSLGDYSASMLKLDEALQRFPDDPRSGDALYYLGLASREAAFADPASRRALLARAAGIFAGLAAGAAAEPLQARNSAFLEADCFYDLGDYEKALSLYDRAVEAHVDTPEATRALFQMANCYHRLGMGQQADATYKRALFNMNREGRPPAPGAQFYKSLADWRSPGEA